ncbi:MAG TPA: ABC transporter permease [Acidimicrobiales bacterium]
MGAVRLVFGAELRRRWRSWLAISLLVALVGGFVLAAAAAGRRTDSAFPSFLAAYGYDAVAYASQPVPKLARLPEVASAVHTFVPLSGQPSCTCGHVINANDLGVQVLPTGKPIVNLVSGRFPDPSSPDQALASFTLQHDYGVQIGTVIRVPFYAPSQLEAAFSAMGTPPRPRGPTVALHVVGIEASEGEFPSGTTPSYSLYPGQAFARTVVPRTANAHVYLVRLRHGAADLPQLSAHVNSLAAAGLVGFQNSNQSDASIEASIHPQAIGWWVLAALGIFVGLLVIGQALGRQSVVESEEFPTLATLGMDQGQFVALATVRNLVVALAGAAGAVALAVALSPLTPVGEARLAEPSTGVKFDTLVLPLGALATVAVVLVLGLWPALRAARTMPTDTEPVGSRPSAVVAQLAATGAPPSAVIGVRHALQRGRGRATVPVGTALLGTVLAVIALCGTAVFGASLTHLTANPKLYGDPFQLNFSIGGGPVDPVLMKDLEHNPAVTGISRGVAAEISVNKVTVGAVVGTALRGALLFSTVDGHLPSSDGEIGLGATTMRQAGAHVGSIVRVTVTAPSGDKRTVPFRVVSRVSFPVLSGTSGLGTGALFTTSAYLAAACPAGPRQLACRNAITGSPNGGVLASVVPGPRGQVAIDHYVNTYRSITALPITPTSLVNFGEAVNFPLIFGVMLGVFGAATLAHLLLVSVARRRKEIGLLKVLGFVKHQVGSAVAWQATTLAVVGVIVGVPLGVAAGQAVWKAFASNLGVVPVSVVPMWLVAGLVVGVVVVANLLAIAPALVATGSKPGQLLRER